MCIRDRLQFIPYVIHSKRPAADFSFLCNFDQFQMCIRDSPYTPVNAPVFRKGPRRNGIARLPAGHRTFLIDALSRLPPAELIPRLLYRLRHRRLTRSEPPAEYVLRFLIYKARLGRALIYSRRDVLVSQNHIRPVRPRMRLNAHARLCRVPVPRIRCV